VDTVSGFQGLVALTNPELLSGARANRSSTSKALVFSKIGTTEPLPNGAKAEYSDGTNLKVFVPGDVPHAGYSSTTINKQ
jgi:hypothetical protein